MEEALEALQTEREAKYALKKELDHKMANFSSVYNLSNLAMNFKLGTFHVHQCPRFLNFWIYQSMMYSCFRWFSGWDRRRRRHECWRQPSVEAIRSWLFETTRKTWRWGWAERVNCLWQASQTPSPQRSWRFVLRNSFEWAEEVGTKTWAGELVFFLLTIFRFLIVLLCLFNRLNQTRWRWRRIWKKFKSVWKEPRTKSASIKLGYSRLRLVWRLWSLCS